MIFLNTRPHITMALVAKILHLSCAGLYIIGGTLILVLPQFQASGGIYLVGVMSILIGIAGIYGYFSNDMYRLAFQSDFALGIFMVIFGSLLLTQNSSLGQMLPCSVGILAIVDGGNQCQISLEGKQFGLSKWYIVLMCGILECAAGILTTLPVLSGAPNSPAMGIALIIIGAVNFFTILYTVSIRGRKHPKSSTIEKESEKEHE